MTQRNPIMVAVFTLLTFGIYGIYWFVVTKGEMNRNGAQIPTAWLIIIPFVSIWWMWKYSEGVEQVTGGKTSGVLAFVLLWLLGFIGQAIIQDGFNKTGGNVAGPAPGAGPMPPSGGPTPPAGPNPPAAGGPTIPPRQ